MEGRRPRRPGSEAAAPPTMKQGITVKKAPIAWTIAGSDTGGGAGIQTDIKVMNAFGVHSCSVITALTAQNTCGVLAVEPVSEVLFQAQLEALHNDLPPAAIKTGMLGSTTNCTILARFLATCHPSRAPLVCDPILKSSSGANLLDPEALEILKQAILPNVDVLTPNLPETRSLIGADIQDVGDAAKTILGMGVRSVLIKGGHATGDVCRDFWTDGSQSFWLSSPRINTKETHGTGCILSSAIASNLALGFSIPEAIVTAKTFLNQCLKSPAHLGSGHGPMRIMSFRDSEDDRPSID